MKPPQQRTYRTSKAGQFLFQDLGCLGVRSSNLYQYVAFPCLAQAESAQRAEVINPCYSLFQSDWMFSSSTRLDAE